MGGFRRVLVIDDQRDTCELFARQVRKEYEVFQAGNLEEARELLIRHQIRLVVCDYALGSVDGVTLLTELRSIDPGLVAILISGYSEIDPLMAAMNSGLIFRFLLKPWRQEDLLLLLEHASAQLSATTGPVASESEEGSASAAVTAPAGLVAESRVMRAALQRAARVAKSSATVLLQGESGVGKEVMARYIHDQSARADKPFVAINCGALTETLLESELFGHEKGAFTGADQQRAGKFEVADGGTLFLDEIGDISPRLQVILLRVLEARCFERVGGTKTVHVDVRIVAATLKPLAALVESQSFRTDLYYRLNVFPIEIPPLRDRHEDMIALAQQFLNTSKDDSAKRSLTEGAMQALCEHSWPGNVRELRNVMDRMKILADESVIDADLVELSLGASKPVASPVGSPMAPSMPVERRVDDNWEQRMESQQRSRLKHALIHCEGNRSEAARSLGMKRTTFLYQCRKSGLL